MIISKKNNKTCVQTKNIEIANEFAEELQFMERFYFPKTENKRAEGNYLHIDRRLNIAEIATLKKRLRGVGIKTPPKIITGFKGCLLSGIGLEYF